MKSHSAPPALPRAFPGLPALAAIALAVTACEKETVPEAPPPVVQVMPAAKQSVVRSAIFIGQLDSPQNVEVRARVESFVEAIHVDEGREVTAGTLLFELNKQPYIEQLAAAEGMLAESNAALNKAKDDVARLTPLFAANAVAKKDLDAAVSAVQVRQAEVSSAEARVKSAQLDLGYCDVKAPIDGRIGARDVSIGSLVGKGEPTLLATISQVDPIWFYCSISEVDFLRAERLARDAGREMGELPVDLILADGSEHPEKGKWVFIDRIVDPTTATIRGRAEFPNPGKVLRPGMFGRIRVNVPQAADRVVVPDRAVVELQGRNFLWIIGADNKAAQRPVEIAPARVGSSAIVLSGVQPGETLVVEGLQKLREGLAVRTAPWAPPAPPAAPGAAPQSQPATDKE